MKNKTRNSPILIVEAVDVLDLLGLYPLPYSLDRKTGSKSSFKLTANSSKI
jgi:hypothetical protein